MNRSSGLQSQPSKKQKHVPAVSFPEEYSNTQDENFDIVWDENKTSDGPIDQRANVTLEPTDRYSVHVLYSILLWFPKILQ